MKYTLIKASVLTNFAWIIIWWTPESCNYWFNRIQINNTSTTVPVSLSSEEKWYEPQDKFYNFCAIFLSRKNRIPYKSLIAYHGIHYQETNGCPLILHHLTPGSIFFIYIRRSRRTENFFFKCEQQNSVCPFQASTRKQLWIPCQ